MKFTVNKCSMGDPSVPNGTMEWEEVTGKCDNCGLELEVEDDVYLYEGKHVCDDCLKELAFAGNVGGLYAEECESAESSYWDRKYDEMRDERLQ